MQLLHAVHSVCNLHRLPQSNRQNNGTRRVLQFGNLQCLQAQTGSKQDTALVATAMANTSRQVSLATATQVQPSGCGT
jgi:hypothetical protein